MTPCKRGPAPPAFAREGQQIGRIYAERRRADQDHKFRWPERDGRSLGEVAREALEEMRVRAVDHFRPKGVPEFYELVCEWTNLFLACTACNHAKRDRWDDGLLRPDDAEFRFERYFDFDPTTGELSPAFGASEPDRRRARATIDILDLNRADACRSRKRAMRAFLAAADEEPHDHGYRYLLPLLHDAKQQRRQLT